jgi:hypothetical protein
LILEGKKKRREGREKKGRKKGTNPKYFNFSVACASVCIVFMLNHNIRYISYCGCHEYNLKTKALKVITLCAVDQSAI